MNDIFNWSRFGRYLKHDLLRCFRSYKLAALLLALLPLILLVLAFAFSLVFDLEQRTPSAELRLGFGYAALTVFVFSFPSRAYGLITDKRRGAAWMLVPVSMLEKFASMILITLVIAPVVLIGTHLTLDAAICSIFPSCGESLWSGLTEALQENTSGSMKIYKDVDAVNIISEWTLGYTVFINTMFNNLLIFLLGAVIFKRHKIATTFLACIGLTIVLSLLLGGISAAIGPRLDGIEINDEASVSALVHIFIAVRTLFAALLAFLVYLRLRTIRY